MRRAGRRGAFEPVGDVLEQLLKSMRLPERFAAAEATDRWAGAVQAETNGTEALARTRCVGVRDGELLVEVLGAVWMGHLAVLRQGILDRMNETLPAGKRIRAIRFVPMRTKEEIER